MSGPGPTVVAFARPLFTPGAKTLVYTLPAAAAKGDTLVAIAAYDPADAFVTPAGWTLVTTYVGTVKIAILARMVDDNEPATMTLAITSAAKEWQGCELVLRPAQSGTVLEASAGADFAAAANPQAPAVACRQAIDLEACVWSVAGAAAPTLPVGLAVLDSYSTALATSRSFMIATAIANATGNLPARATTCAAVTGSSASLVLRSRPPVAPAELYDPIPGHIGLI